MEYKYKDIDYSGVQKKIVEQAFASANTLNEEQKRKLIQEKFDRAFELREALKKSELLWHTDR